MRNVEKTNGASFDARKTDEYAVQAKASWGKTKAWREYEQKSAGRSKEEEKHLGTAMMEIFAELGQLKENSPQADQAQAVVRKLQNYITENFYTCTDEILESLGLMYIGGGDMTKNIDKAGGEGTAVFVNQAIQAYIKNMTLVKW